MIGMIIPPGDIKKIVDKTALHVAKYGSQFEKALLEKQQHKPQFSFFVKENPYRPYYDHMVTENKRKLMQENEEVENRQQEQIKIEKKEEQVINTDQKQFLEKIFQEVPEPEADRFTANQVPEKLNRGQIALIQHTAQYVAINDKQFLEGVKGRQINNIQYQFLRSSSENYEYYTKLVSSYKNIMEYSKDDMNNLMQCANNKKAILQKCQGIYEYHKMMNEQNKNKKQTQENKNEKNVDWNDFQLVETIMFDDFKPKSNEVAFNKPLYNKNLQQKIISQPKRKQILQQCHICKKNIMNSEMNKHLKSCLSIKKNDQGFGAQSNNQVGEDIDIRKNLENLSSKRPDIFGGEGEKIKNKIGEKKEEKLVWDGQDPNITRGSGSSAMLANQQKKLKNKLMEGK